ncbi:acyl-CoA thioesterase II [Aspergillus niger CBS 101883]|uniref:acyl-CoA thioesterase II n=1 Tax=Aspergillus lacticoffeatus (strain CBS 101883) TaxID=1450533 RepID=UPI000D7FD97E|nr:acyl-CoA thioesterase II [Aspergillus niger CBS 101883]PYH57290.1 acyl-CoA thioesterase II [Aspergillus niger CBS 101883]
MAQSATLFKPPPLDSTKAPIENVLELTPVIDVGKDVFTNTRPLWHPPGARGIYGGAAIAQCLAAALRTVPADFAVHSMHCYFLLAGDSEIPILYHVERVRDGRSYITRTVQAKQRGRPIFTTTLSFNKANSGGKKKLEHASSMPAVTLPEEPGPGSKRKFEESGGGPFESQRAGVIDRQYLWCVGRARDYMLTVSGNLPPQERKTRRFMRSRGKISDAGGHQAHLSALAYMTDSYFIGTVSRVHNIPRFSSPEELKKALNALKNPSDLDDEDIARALKELKEEETADLRRRLEGALHKVTTQPPQEHKEVGMMVSLDHSIHFHNPWAFRADEWMLTEMESPWAGEGRGLVLQKIWSKDGTLIATCTQEGVVRLKQDEPPRSKL